MNFIFNFDIVAVTTINFRHEVYCRICLFKLLKLVTPNVFTFEDVQYSPLVQVAIPIATTATTCTSGTNRDSE